VREVRERPDPAADVVRLMAGRRSRVEYRPVGELALKGLSDPVATVELLWEPLAGSAVGTVPSPARDGATVRRRRRERHRARTHRRRRQAHLRKRRSRGPPGVRRGWAGKTTLVAEAARSAYDAAPASCSVTARRPRHPLQLFAEGTRHYVAHTEESSCANWSSTRIGVDAPRPGPRQSDPRPAPVKGHDSDSERYLLFAAAVGLLGSISQQQPVVLVLDDLQWADNASLLLLRHLVAAEHPVRLLVLGTFRDSELAQSPGLRETLGLLRRHRGFTRLELEASTRTACSPSWRPRPAMH